MKNVYALVLIYLSLALFASSANASGDYRKWGNLTNGGIESRVPNPKKFASITQGVPVDPSYYGKTINFSIHVEPTFVTGWAGLWLRLEYENGDIAGFDNMDDKPIKGSSGWKQYKNSLYVPRGTKRLVFGVLLEGDGKIRVSDYRVYKSMR